jgi:hypothetical protein
VIIRYRLKDKITNSMLVTVVHYVVGFSIRWWCFHTAAGSGLAALHSEHNGYHKLCKGLCYVVDYVSAQGALLPKS